MAAQALDVPPFGRRLKRLAWLPSMISPITADSADSSPRNCPNHGVKHAIVLKNVVVKREVGVGRQYREGKQRPPELDARL
ncbi:hypothetical protein [Mesorhizobium shangrilense]|uniref:Uncharacterized protein n=1 Tax=Mesorhizobium shangrilense TaxID=460060 RepID=A0ABV2DLW1_9HYPH